MGCDKSEQKLRTMVANPKTAEKDGEIEKENKLKCNIMLNLIP